ncbi:hypothetical protein BGX30_000514 [Mortierella sp. GBA39]|nr:hypothetical protein BGX30_000514 [Mortierella sp. GBA39]
MFRSTLLLTLAFAASVANVAAISLISSHFLNGPIMPCQEATKFDTCYRFAADLFLKSFSSTFNPSPACNGYYERYSKRPNESDPYNINDVSTLNDNFRSFKVADFETSTASGHAGNSGEPSELGGCILVSN